MAHALTINKENKVEMFSGNNIVPWHGLGTVVKGLLTSAEAIKAAHMDWKVKKLPVFAEGNGDYSVIPEFFRIAREDNNLTLSIVGKRYHPIQNIDAFDFFDSVVGGKHAIYDTAGSLNEGRRIWIMAEMKGSFFVSGRKDDEIKKYVLLASTHDGTGSLTMQLVTVRVVCQNTLSAALTGAANRIAIRHTPNFQAKIDAASRVLGISRKYFQTFEEFINTLNKKKMSVKQAENFVKDLIPFTQDKESTRTKNIHNAILDLFETGKGNKGETRWDALNAVTDFIDHVRGTRASEGVNESEKRFESALMASGAKIKQRAVSLLLK